MANSTLPYYGISDTGWITLNSTYPTSYRKKNGFVTVVMRLSGGATPADGTLLGTLPEEYRPGIQITSATHNLRGAFMVSDDGKVTISKNSVIQSVELNNYMGVTVTYPV